MGLSFSGPTAPAEQRSRVFRWAAYFLFSATVSACLTALAVAALYVTSAPAWLSAVFQPLSFALLPGFLLESLDTNPYAFSRKGAILLSFALYTIVLFWLLCRRKQRSTRSI